MLFDIIRHARYSESPDAIAPEIARQRDLLVASGPIVIETTNVAEWVEEHIIEGEMGWGDQWKLFGERSVPQFASAFVEFIRPRDNKRYGVFVCREEIPLEAGGGWNVTAQVWTLPFCADSLPCNDSVTWRIPFDATARADWRQVEHTPCTDPSCPDPDVHVQGCASAMLIALLAFRFMHAKNVTLDQVQAPRHERRQAEKSGQPAPIRYHTINVGPITTRLASIGRIRELGVEKAFHLCRGYFADYTKGAGLFGKYKVEVFVPEHFRGSKKRGQVVSDYQVSP